MNLAKGVKVYYNKLQISQNKDNDGEVKIRTGQEN